jgi:hypothetical protein
MGKFKIVKLASTVIATIGLVAGLGVLSAGTALAASTPGAAHTSTASAPVSADYAIVVPVETVDGYRAPLFNSSGTLVAKLAAGTLVEVTCYYDGSPPAPYLSDGYLDHVVWVSSIGDFTGHVPDDYVNLGGDTPPEYGVPKC